VPVVLALLASVTVQMEVQPPKLLAVVAAEVVNVTERPLVTGERERLILVDQVEREQFTLLARLLVLRMVARLREPVEPSQHFVVQTVLV